MSYTEFVEKKLNDLRETDIALREKIQNVSGPNRIEEYKRLQRMVVENAEKKLEVTSKYCDIMFAE